MSGRSGRIVGRVAMIETSRISKLLDSCAVTNSLYIRTIVNEFLGCIQSLVVLSYMDVFLVGFRQPALRRRASEPPQLEM